MKCSVFLLALVLCSCASHSYYRKTITEVKEGYPQDNIPDTAIISPVK